MIPETESNRLFDPRYIPVFIFGLMTFVSWQRWTPLIVDLGREMDLPFRLLSGEMLYRDILYTYPPFSPYFNALLYNIFGVHLNVLIGSGFILSILLSILCYRISRRILPKFESSITVSLIIILLIFKPNGNLIQPYSFSAYHAAIFSLLTILFVLRYAEKRKKLELICAGVFTGLTLISKHEFSLVAVVTVCATLTYLHVNDIKTLLKRLHYVGVPAAIISFPVYGLLFYLIDWHTLIVDCHLFYTHIPKSLVIYNQFRSGFDNPLYSFVQMIGAFALSAMVLSLIVFFCDVTKKTSRTAFLLIVISSITAFSILFFSFGDWEGSPLRALPIFLIATIIYQWFKRKENTSSSGDPSENLHRVFILILSVGALTALSRVFLRIPGGGFAGNLYIQVSLIMVSYLLMSGLPTAIKKWTNDRSSYRRARILGIGFCLTVSLLSTVVFCIRYSRNSYLEVKATRGHVFIDKREGVVINQTLRFIENNTRPGEIISVLPEGNALAFLTNRKINLRHQIFIPDFLSENGELSVINKLQNAKVKYVFLVNRKMAEFGKDKFGQDFYTKLMGWIENNYEIVEVYGAPGQNDIEIGDNKFFIKIYKLSKQAK